jgi:hypothetical protein
VISLKSVTFASSFVEVDERAFENSQSLDKDISPSCHIFDLENVGHRYFL